MIPPANVTAWRATVPWVTDEQVEQDLLLSRTLIECFSLPALHNAMAFRGGTALNKLVFPTPTRYSEDIDLVQLVPGRIGAVLNPLQAHLEGLLGQARVSRRTHSARMDFRWTAATGTPMRLKVEINTREHAPMHPVVRQRFSVTNAWWSGHTDIVTYTPAELLGTKLRALYQRVKGRDLYDLWMAHHHALATPAEIVAAFKHYIGQQGVGVTRAQFAANIQAKMTNPVFLGDTEPLLADGATSYDAHVAHQYLAGHILPLL